MKDMTMQNDGKGPGLGKGCRKFDCRLVDRMIPMIEKKSDPEFNRLFGISYNTWRKLEKGVPVRASVLDRLEARLALLEASR